jgi:hypothetical protein
MEHRDSMGNCGRLVSGSLQWMTAGSGIIHSEMPKQVSGVMWGFQLWVNLPGAVPYCGNSYLSLMRHPPGFGQKRQFRRNRLELRWPLGN